jgi:hypothetical protein
MSSDNRKEFYRCGVDPTEQVQFVLVVRGSKLLLASRLHEFANYVRRGIPFMQDKTCLDADGITTALCAVSMSPVGDRDSDEALLEKYGAEGGGEILRLLQELELMKLSSNATFWRDRYFRLFDQLAQLADLVGAPRASNYETGHVLEAVKKKLSELKEQVDAHRAG